MSLLLVAAVLGTSVQAAPLARLPEITLDAESRIMVIAPHPDDEVLCCAGVLQEALARRLPVRLVFLTYGDSNEWSFIAYNKRPTVFAGTARKMGKLRRDEALAAAALIGVPNESIVFLGYPDHGTMAMWRRHWRGRSPYRSPMTLARRVPYPSAYRHDAPHKPEEVVRDLEKLIGEFRPTHIFVSHPADHHPDHAALYLYTRVALWNLGDHVRSRVLPFLIHFPGWPGSKGFEPSRTFGPPASLARELTWSRFTLTPQRIAGKKLALELHRTQFRYSASRLLPFVREVELFGEFPGYDLRGGGPTIRAATLADEEGPGSLYVFQDTPETVRITAEKNYLDIRRARVWVQDGELRASIATRSRIGPSAELSFYLFGYRDDTAFAMMPKLEVRAVGSGVAVFDNGSPVTRKGAAVTLLADRIDVRIALASLGSPERILVGGRSYAAGLDMDLLAWRVFRIR